MGIKSKSKKILLIALLSLLTTNITHASFFSFYSFSNPFNWYPFQKVGNFVSSVLDCDRLVICGLFGLAFYFSRKNYNQKEEEYKSKIEKLKRKKAQLENEIEARNKHHNECVMNVRMSILTGKMKPLSKNLYLHNDHSSTLNVDIIN